MFLNTFCSNNQEKIAENLLLYCENLLFLFRVARSSQESFETFEEIPVNPPALGLMFEKNWLFQAKNKLSRKNLEHFCEIITRILKKTLKNLPENLEIGFEGFKFLQICEEIFVSDQKTLENIEQKDKQRFLTSGMLESEEFIKVSLAFIRNILRVLVVFCEMYLYLNNKFVITLISFRGEGVMLKSSGWLQNALLFVGTYFHRLFL